MPNLHPIFVHLPIALLTVSFLFDFAGYVKGKQEFLKAGWWMLLAGVTGLAGTVVTGLLAQQSVNIPNAASEHFETHEQIAFVIAGLYATILLWRVANRSSLPKGKEKLFLLLTFLGVCGIWAGAWYGGELVFRFGVGVQTSSTGI